ncbi:MAG: hypothetical protein ANABAC_1962 [Anaerolineae bacterium]|nr:MAG: hypothetical protein ANABAC_1962 [Anaerolineae bacterium]
MTLFAAFILIILTHVTAYLPGFGRLKPFLDHKNSGQSDSLR